MGTSFSKVSGSDMLSLKVAARRLIERAGGLESAESVCRVSKTSLSYYASTTHDQHMPADVIADLEADIGMPLVTRQLAHIAGFDLVPARPEAAGDNADITHTILRVTRELGDVAKVVDDMDADGIRTVTELDCCIKEVQDLKVQVDALFDRLHQQRTRQSGK